MPLSEECSPFSLSSAAAHPLHAGSLCASYKKEKSATCWSDNRTVISASFENNDPFA